MFSHGFSKSRLARKNMKTAAGANAATPMTAVFKAGPSTASQTACRHSFAHSTIPTSAFNAASNTSFAHNADGSWTEHETTGTGFPKFI
jgi:hypothetical protein